MATWATVMVRANTSMPMDICYCSQNVPFGWLQIFIHICPIMFNWPVQIYDLLPKSVVKVKGRTEFSEWLSLWKELFDVHAVAFGDTAGQRVFVNICSFFSIFWHAWKIPYIASENKYNISFLKHQVLTLIPLYELVARLPQKSAEVRNTTQDVRSTDLDPVVTDII